MKSDRKIQGKVALAVVLAGTLLLAACNEGSPPRQLVDVKPVGEGLTFLGLAGVLSALILVFGKFIGESKLTGYSPFIMAGLGLLLTLVVVVTAIPKLIIPVTVAAAVLVIVAVVGHRWK